MMNAAPAKQCPKCGQPMELRAAQFHFRGRNFAGWVCGPCNSLWEAEGDSMFEHAAALALLRHEAGANYRLLENGAMQCLLCGAASHNPNDAAQRYCGRCHVFVEDVPLHGGA
jgi:hypothetical protein